MKNTLKNVHFQVFKHYLLLLVLFNFKLAKKMFKNFLKNSYYVQML